MGISGGISIAWIERNGEQIKINHLQPFCHKDFENCIYNGKYPTIGDLIKDLSACVYLYPNISKDVAFRDYYTPIKVFSSNGYVKSKRKFDFYHICI